MGEITTKIKELDTSTLRRMAEDTELDWSTREWAGIELQRRRRELYFDKEE